MSRRVRLLLGLLGLVSTASAQIPEGWYALSGDLSLPGPFNVSLEGNHRRVGSWANQSFLEAGFQWEINKHWKLAAGHRWGAEGPVNAAEHLFHRYQLDLAWDDKVGEWKLKARVRQQWKHTDWVRSEMGWLPARTGRLKVSAERDLHKHWEAEGGGEVFIPQGVAAGSVAGKLESYRIFVGVSHEISKRLDLGAKCMLDADFGDPLSDAALIFSIGLDVDIDKTLKRLRKRRQER